MGILRARSKIGALLLLACLSNAFVPEGATLFRSPALLSTLQPRVNGDVLDPVPLVPDNVIFDRLEVLNEALVSYNSTGAAEILSELGEMRQNKTDDKVIETLMNGLLSEGPDRPLPLWARFPPLTRFSKRARLASLKRTLDLTTPPPSIEDAEEDDINAQQRRRRRALISLLRTLADPSDGPAGGVAIRSIEKKAKRAQNGGGKEDLTQRRPEDLETPEYTVVSTAGPVGYEVRQYEPFSVCTVSMNKPRPVDSYTTDATVVDPKMASARAFGALAGYLFGKNQQEQAMKMTTPVLTNERIGEKQMSFILPSEFWKDSGIETAPAPIDGSGVTLERNEGGPRAVLMFGGYASKKGVSKRKEQLLKALGKDREWDAVDDAPVALAQYNDPFTPPWKRLNEVSVPVKPRA